MIALRFPKEDTELINELNANFSDIQYFEANGFSGGEVFLVAVVPVTALTIQIIDFILNHFVDKKEDAVKKERSIINKGEKIELPTERKALAKKLSVSFNLSIDFKIEE